MLARITPNFHRLKGFTLVELLWTIALFGVLLLAGLPTLNNMVGRYQADASFRNFRNVVSYARAEAIIRRAEVVLCPRATTSSLACYSGSVTTSNQSDVWKTGWILFVNRSGGDTDIDESNGDLILKVYEAVDDRMTLKVGALKRVLFNYRGSSATFSALFCLMDNSDVIYGGKLTFDAGRVRMVDKTTAEGDCAA